MTTDVRIFVEVAGEKRFDEAKVGIGHMTCTAIHAQFWARRQEMPPLLRQKTEILPLPAWRDDVDSGLRGY